MSVPSESTRAGRAARAALATAVAVLVALAAHLAGGGAVPPLGVVVAVSVVLQPVALLLVGRRPRLWRQAAVVGLAQATMHGLFALTAGAAPALSTAAMPGMPGMGTRLAATTATPDHAGMLGWHLLACAATVALWRWSERAVAAILGGARTAVRLLAAVPAAAPRAVAAVWWATEILRPGRRIRRAPSRAPPLPC